MMKRVKNAKGSTKKVRRQSPKQVIVKATRAIAKAVDKYRLSAQFQKRLAKSLLKLLSEVQAQAVAVGCCTVYLNGTSVSFGSGPYFCQQMGGQFDPEPC